MRVSVNKERCNGNGLCVKICPKVFKLENGQSVAKVSTITSELQPKCEEAVYKCPENAIVLED